MPYTYLGDRFTRQDLKRASCEAVRRPDGKCIRGKNGSMLVQFDNGEIVIVVARLLRKRKLMANKYRKITISVSDDELNALEDYIVTDFKSNEKREEKCRRKSLSIWGRLVREWDKPKSNVSITKPQTR